MFLNFIGSGSALNTSLGNNSAFIKNGKTLLLLDCGSTTFSRMQSLNLLDDVEQLYVLITHRHPDHSSSLGDLIFYTHYILKTKTTILTPEDENLICLLKYMGVASDLYDIVKLEKKHSIANEEVHISIDFLPVSHVEDMECYGYILNYKGTCVYYSGDTNDMSAAVIQKFQNHEINYIYQDVCSYNYPNNPHMHIGKLCGLIGENDRERVYCMHLDEQFDKKEAINLGFHVVENYFNKNI